MEWAKDPLLAKAKKYAAMANDEDIHSAQFGFWMSLATEMLARAALSNVHPVLLADPTSENNIYYVFGKNTKSNPRSVHAKTVFARCAVFFDDFTEKMAGHCLIIADRRNKELHSGEAAFEGIDPSTWLPETYEIFKTLLEQLGMKLEDFLGKAHHDVAAKMLEDRGAAIEKEVKDAISARKKEFDGLSGEEKGERTAKAAKALATWLHGNPLGRKVDCPACGFPGALGGEATNRGPVKVSEFDGTITREVRVLPTKFTCPSCKLEIDGYNRLHLVGLGQVFTNTEDEDPIEFFGIDPEEHVDIDQVLERYHAEEVWGWQNE